MPLNKLYTSRKLPGKKKEYFPIVFMRGRFVLINEVFHTATEAENRAKDLQKEHDHPTETVLIEEKSGEPGQA